jgi:serine/threonine-protein kinase HipA
MKKQLNVYLGSDLVGYLGQNESGVIWFRYTAKWCGQTGAIALSQSLPLREEVYSGKECAGFFGGVLPEGKMRKLVAKNVGRSARNDYALLEEIGGDCAGAVSFFTEGEMPIEEDEQIELLDEDDLRELLDELPRRPLMAGRKEVRLSLAGAQSKLAVRCDENGCIGLPLGNTASTHIITPEEAHFVGLASNEAFCLRLAREVGLPAVQAEVRKLDQHVYLLVERYDRMKVRRDKGMARIVRLHQEDFCQAMGVVSEMKYQNEGGPSMEQCFELIRGSSGMAGKDVLTFFDAVVFNYLIGNNDAHGKNFSLIYHDGGVRMAPLYDLVCTVYYPELSQKFAMKIGGEYRPAWVKVRHWHRMFVMSGLSPRLAGRRAIALSKKLSRLALELAQTDLECAIAEVVQKNSEALCACLDSEG